MEFLIFITIIYIIGFALCMVFVIFLEAGYTSLDGWERRDTVDMVKSFGYIPFLNIVMLIVNIIVVFFKTVGRRITNVVDDAIDSFVEKIKRK